LTPPKRTDLLIVGAGPFGLAVAAHARHLGIDPLVVGEPMRFWRAHMPNGMYLRSACDWHLDPEGVHTIHAFLRTRGLTPADVEPLSRDFYLEYARWFQAQKQIDPWPVFVERLDTLGGGDDRLLATLAGGETIAARNVVLALGFQPFSRIPDELRSLLPPDRVQHTRDAVDFSALRGERCLIIGGRQSAFEWAALMAEAGAGAVHVVYRHETPAFTRSEWGWVGDLVDGLLENPRWYRELTQVEKDDLGRRFWAEGRLKLEPWLADRVHREPIRLRPRTRAIACRQQADGSLRITLDSAGRPDDVLVDRVVLATGYAVDISRVPLLARGNVLAQLRIEDNFPVLDDRLQTSTPGLFMTSMPATRDFGPFFGFTVSVRTSAKLIGRALVPSARPAVSPAGQPAAS
jgi:cation diffusion facilitator CzcD-associated flavoprotein CzcO